MESEDDFTQQPAELVSKKLPFRIKLVFSYQFISSMAYMILLPFYPKFLREKGIDKEFMGFVMSTFSTFFIIGAFLTGNFILKYIDRLTGCYIGSSLIIIQLIGLGMLIMIEDSWTIIYLSILC